MPTPAPSRSSRPWLVWRFAAASLVAFMLIGGVVTVVMVRVVRQRAEEHAKFHATYVVDAVLAPGLRNVPLDAPLTGQNLERIDRLVHDRILSDGRSVRVKIWAPDGTVLYSDNRSLIGQSFPEEHGELQAVLDGEIENGISDLQARENVGERQIADKLFQTYAPLRRSPQQAPVAVAEIYQDYSAIQGEIDALGRVLVATFAVGLVVLYALLLPIAFRAARSLRRKNEQLKDQAQRLETLLSREQETVAELRNLNRMQTDFVAASSHELRTPLTSVIGYLRTLRQPNMLDDPALAKEFLATAEHQATRLSLLVQKLLSTAALEDGARPVETSAFQLADLVAVVLNDVPTGADRVHLHIEGSPTVRTDRDRLHEILLNVVENALKYSPGDSAVHVEAECSEDELVVHVRDRGIGIDPADQETIFERFRQVDQSATRRFDGLGLGLHLSKGLCSDLGGTIDVRSAAGEGSTFTVRIPMTGIGNQPVESAATSASS
ncbi:MAG: HAMP domain-containing histidine kinase [Actinomycetota bacterium]|nr:HAMP domain-containing histidine kinase [Actinomycetota bacterium]